MAQFDIYKNPSKNAKRIYPYIVDVQNPAISDIATRIVVPLGIYSYFKSQAMTGLTPELIFNKERLLLFTPQIAAIPSSLVKMPIGSLNFFRNEIISALDFAITGV